MIKPLSVLALLCYASSAFAELRVPAFTAYLDPDPNGAKITKEGISGWTNPQITVSWFGEIKNAGMLDVSLVLRLPQGADSRLRLTVAGQKRDLMTKAALEGDMRLVRFEEGRLEVALEPNASKTMISELARKFELWTGRRWTVIVSNEQGQPTLRSVSQAAKQEHARSAEADPRVQEVLSRFPGAKVVEVRRLAPETPESNINADYGSDDPPDGSDTDDDL